MPRSRDTKNGRSLDLTLVMRPVSLLVLSAFSALPVLASASPGSPIVGYLGQTKMAALLYGAPSSKAKAIKPITAGTRLVICPAGKLWYGVFMAGRRKAYVPAQAVDIPVDPATGQVHGFTAADVASIRAQIRRPVYEASRGSYVPRGAYTRGSSDARVRMAAEAMSLEGTTPYKWGGNELGSGIDCSGFVKKMYGAIGYSLPRTAAEQANVGIPITRYEDLQPGDRLYFWDAKKGKIGHTGLYVGGGYFTHSSSGHHGIARDFLSDRWRRICIAARR